MKDTDEQKILVELACSTTLVPAFNPAVFHQILPSQDGADRCVVFIVCGGFKTSLEEMKEFREVVSESTDRWEVVYDDGVTIAVPRPCPS